MDQLLSNDALREVVLQVLIKRAQQKEPLRHTVNQLIIGYDGVQDYLAHRGGRHESSFELTALKRCNKFLYNLIKPFNKEETYQHGFDLQLYLIKEGKKFKLPRPLRLKLKFWYGRQ